ncbi:Nucleoside-diphosphate-sugar epimerase [Microbacterium azadirachtae]|uniref:Nucleoside-diphosphate-sugar epimerase n=1 Tax=Microbacterium azadirachtae TaxID=582680 RepID=A0A1I6JGN8_9MICO|nr:NAD-dependent epimerase/dehydratase family protein [Microbacterium azadirachtae]SFR78044.1 Nucleoside-diphosphate-sugar epimerase [Microbacterium azadirachtae]
MKALVTGAAGFVGSGISRRLLSEGHQVVGIDALTAYYAEALKRRNLQELESDSFTFHESDINEADLDTLLADVDMVYHQAGQPGVRSSWGQEFESYTRNNVLATQKLLEAAARNGKLRKFVYASSSSIYGDAERFPTTEGDLPQPVSPYGVTKLAGEHLVSLYGSNFGVPTISLRYFTVYGPGQRPDMAFTRFVQSALSDREIRIFGTGAQIRDFTYIDDVVEANILAGQADAARPGDVVNISGGSNISVNEVLDVLSGLVGHKLNVRYLERSHGDVFRTGGSSDRAAEVIGWTSRTSIESGLARQLEWAQRTIDVWSSLPENTV